MMLMVAAATLETPMNVLLVYIFDEAEIFRIELLVLDREFGRGADLLQPIQVLQCFLVSLLDVAGLEEMDEELLDEIDGRRFRN